MEQYIIAIIMGIMEGMTEFLPISSTGHLILVGSLLGFTGEKAKTFEIIIQLGSILAVAVLYRERYFSFFQKNKERGNTPRLNLIHVMLGIIPAMGVGYLMHGIIKTYLFSPNTVLIGLVVGGLFMIFAEQKSKKIETTANHLDQLSYKQALGIGFFQCLAVYPGFSRSGSTISGGLLMGANYKTSAEFAFLIAVPMMVAASGYDLLKSYQYLSWDDLGLFITGFVTAFIVALLAVVTFLKILQRVKLSTFAYYRFVVAFLYWWFIL